MTDTQPEALRLADELETEFAQGRISNHTGRKAATELRRLHAENETLRARSLPEIKDMHNGPQQLNLSDRAMWVLGWNECRDAARDADRAMRAAQHAGVMLGEQAELRRLSDCCPELNLSNYGPDDVDELNGWAIEVSQCIDRALAAQPAGAQQPGAAYAAQDSEHQRAIMEAERNASLDAYSRVVYLSGAESRLYEAGFTNGWQRASHGQAPAPAQAAHQQEAPAMHSGWVSCTIEFDGSGPEEVAYGPKIMMDRLAKWLGKHFERTIAEKAAPQPLPASQGDALDAARLDWLLLHISGAEFRRIGVHYSGNARRADVDAARKQGANHD